MSRPLLPMPRALLLDMDGTLTRPVLDFEAMREEIGIPQGEPLLEYIRQHFDSVHAAWAHSVIDRHEREAAERAEPNHGFADFRAWLNEFAPVYPIRTAIVTRNSRVAAETTLKRLAFSVDALVTREDASPKPDPQGMLIALACVGLTAKDAAVVGDFRFDIQAGKAAGVAMTVFIHNGDENADCGGADFVLPDLQGLPALFRGV